MEERYWYAISIVCIHLYHACMHVALSPSVSGYLLVANRLYLHQISLDGSRSKVVKGGLGNAIAVDFHFRRSSLYWADSNQRAIMTSSLDGLKISTVMDGALTQPGNI